MNTTPIARFISFKIKKNFLYKTSSIKQLLLLICSLSGINSFSQTTFSESFDGAGFPPSGWTRTIIGGTVNWARVGNPSGTGTQPNNISSHSGAGSAWYNAYNASPGNHAILVTPVYDLRSRGANTVNVSFWMYRDANASYNSSSYPDKLDVYENTSATTIGATLLGTVNRAISLSPVVASGGWYQYSYTIPASYNTANNYLIFDATSGFGDDVFIDDVSWDTFPCSLTGGTASSGSTVCSGTAPAALTLTGQTAGTTLQWQSSPDNSTWTDISGATAASYSPSGPTSTIYFRCSVTNGICMVYSTTVMITVVQPATTGTISGPPMVCSGSPASLILTGYTGTIQWQDSPDNITWTNIAGATSSTYTSAGLMTTKYFRVIITATSPCSGTATSSAFVVTVSASGGIWKGTVSTNWNTAGNWCSATVPTNATDVFIPGGTPFAPTIPGGLTDPNAVCRDLTIYAGATLTVAIGASNSFTIYGNVLNNGTVNHSSSTNLSGVGAGTLGVSNYWIWLAGVNKTISGTGSFANAALDIYTNGNYTLASNITVMGIRTEGSPYGTLNFSSYTLTSTALSQQYGNFNLNTGIFWDKIFAQQFTPAIFNNQSGTWVWDISGKLSNGSMNLQDNDWNNVRLICDPGYNIALSGITDLTLNGNLTIDPNTVLQDGNIPIALKGNWINNGTFTANSIGSGGTPTVTFNGGSAQSIIGNANTFYNLTINNSCVTGVTINQQNTVSNTLTLTAGLINTLANTLIIPSTLPAAITGNNTTSYVNTGSAGTLRRYIAATGAYDLPVGNATSYQLMNLNFTGGNTITYIDVRFDNPSNATGTGLPLTESGYTYNYLLDNAGPSSTIGNTYGGVWTVTPNSGTSTYNVNLYGRNYDNGGTVRNTVLKRNTAGPGAWALVGTYSSSTTSAPITAVRAALTGFSQFAIGTNTAPLPIELVSFNANAIQKDVAVSWTTATETNNDFFTLERSGDGFEFEPVATINGAGNSSVMLDYHYSDTKALSGISYYRLKQTDFNGKSGYSNVRSVTINENGLMPLYPNPANDYINIPFDKSINDADLKIYDVDGIVFYSQKINISTDENIYKVNLDGFPAGMYFINISLPGGKSMNSKFIKK